MIAYDLVRICATVQTAHYWPKLNDLARVIGESRTDVMREALKLSDSGYDDGKPWLRWNPHQRTCLVTDRGKLMIEEWRQNPTIYEYREHHWIQLVREGLSDIRGAVIPAATARTVKDPEEQLLTFMSRLREEERGKLAGESDRRYCPECFRRGRQPFRLLSEYGQGGKYQRPYCNDCRKYRGRAG